MGSLYCCFYQREKRKIFCDGTGHDGQISAAAAVLSIVIASYGTGQEGKSVRSPHKQAGCGIETRPPDVAGAHPGYAGSPLYFLFCSTSNHTARLMIRPLMMSW
jgi:hypothetical protein